jgi:hypothetical protein
MLARSFAAALTLGLITGCMPMSEGWEPFASVPPPDAAPESAAEPAPGPPPPASPAEVRPGPEGDSATWREALAAREARIVVSREEKWLWLMQADSVLLAAPVAVGRDTVFHYDGVAYDFSTPIGRLAVQGKEESPEWVPPDWHYFEKAVEDGLVPVQLAADDSVPLSDGTTIEVREGVVGRVNRFGYWRAFTPGSEIVFDDKIFMPPLDSPQRRVPKVLGTHRLILGDGYLIHGTPEEDTIGEEASHGCVRMFNRDVQRLYGLVEPGTPVFIY